ncbi:MAG: TonB family protein [Bacteroidales bacterium]|nr:TonB family protein [Bacteroidales bacterium]
MTSKKNDIIAITGTILVHILLIVFLIFFGYTAHIPDSEEGLTVNFGNIDVSAGTFEPRGESLSNQQTQPQSPPESSPDRSAQEELISQEDESIALEAARKKAEEEARRLEEERIRQEQELKAAEIREQAAKAFGSKDGQETTDQGYEQEGSGNQGDVQGSTESANITGSSSGYDDFSLDGRSISGSLPRPSYSIEAEGVVVVRIAVNSAGTVISANIDLQGTDTENTELRNAALSAAKKAKFNAIEGTRNQTGTITYRFQLR